MKSPFKSVPERTVLLCGIIWFFMLLAAMVVFGPCLPILLSPTVLLPESLLLADWDHVYIVYLCVAIIIIGFSSLAILAWRRKSTALSFLLLSLTILWGIFYVALWIRFNYIFELMFRSTFGVGPP